MASDVPAFLEEGTPVSAKFKGAFCEATIKSVKKLVKCKIQYKDGTGSAVFSHDYLQGELKLNSLVQVKQDDGEYRNATIQKMNDHSLYTVVFDDGDERTLRRTNVCVMGERHFQEHENLDNLPLTDPENFGTPVLLSTDKRRKRRSQPNLEEEDSDSDGTKPSKRMSEIEKEFLGKVVCIEQGERKKSWFPALGLKRFGSHSDTQIYVQSFKDGKKMLVKKEDIKEFTKEKEPLYSYYKGDTKVEPILKTAIDKALAYHNLGELPKGWNILDTIDEKEESTDEDAPIVMLPVLSADAKAFQENIFSLMKRDGNPITKPPTVNNQGVNLHKLYELVLERGGMEEVTNQHWRTIYTQLGLKNIHTTASYNMKTVYKRYLFPYEELLKNAAKSSPSQMSKIKGKRNNVSQNKEAKDTKDDIDKTSIKSESDSEPDRRRSTRSSRAALEKSTEKNEKRKHIPFVSQEFTDDIVDKTSAKESVDTELDIKSETDDIDVVNSPESSETSDDFEKDDNTIQIGKYKPGTKIAVRYGSGKNLRIYNAKVLEVEKDDNGEVLYYIHYNGWNHRHDEWIKDDRIHGLSSGATHKGKKPTAPPTSHTKIAKDPPQKYKAKLEAESNISSIKRSSSVISTASSTNEKNVSPTPLPPAAKASKSPILPIEKPPSPITAPSLPAVEPPLILPDPVKSVTIVKKSFLPKPASDSLFLPDIKPSPVKPRLTRNSMQDQFLLNALEESIGKSNQAAMSLQQDVLMKAEVPVNRRRSFRQHHNPSPRSDHGESDLSSKDEKEQDDSSKEEMQLKLSEEEKDDNKELPAETKDSSKEESVKKWIEAATKVMTSKSSPQTDNSEDDSKLDRSESNEEPFTEMQFVNTDRSLKPLNQEVDSKKNKNEDCDAELETKENIFMETSNIVKEESTTASDNNNVDTEKDRTSETAQTLSDFCSIVESIPKLKSIVSSDETLPITNTKVSLVPSPQKENDDKSKKKKDKKRRRTNSAMDEEKSTKEKKGRKMSQPLDYNVDFMSDLDEALREKEPVERIGIMQSRLNQMRKLYSKLRTEVANIDRRKRRKLRKELEQKQKTSL